MINLTERASMGLIVAIVDEPYRIYVVKDVVASSYD